MKVSEALGILEGNVYGQGGLLGTRGGEWQVPELGVFLLVCVGRHVGSDVISKCRLRGRCVCYVAPTTVRTKPSFYGVEHNDVGLFSLGIFTKFRRVPSRRVFPS
jgi:hypothetical protein